MIAIRSDIGKKRLKGLRYDPTLPIAIEKLLLRLTSSSSSRGEEIIHTSPKKI
jgi:hypothetical protein